MLVDIVRRDERYRVDFAHTFSIDPGTISVEHIVHALAAFERTLVLGDSPVDRYLYARDATALSPSAVRGMNLFRGRAQCATCHLIGKESALLTDDRYHSIGIGLPPIAAELAALTQKVANTPESQLDALIGSSPAVAALGRFVVTKDPRDIGNFKTPSLRNVALTAPYMHDGSVGTLEEALDFELYYRSTEKNEPLILTPAEKADLIAFLLALTSPEALRYTAQ